MFGCQLLQGYRHGMCNAFIFSSGMSISGGSDSNTQPHIRIQTVYPGGAAAMDGTLVVSSSG